MNIVLCFSGGIASGKTTLAMAVADRLGFKVATFGGFVRGVARTRGISERREDLQALGEALIQEMGWEDFCSSVLRVAGWAPSASIVVDGIRHVSAFEAIKKLVAPVPAKLIFVDVPRAVRQARSDETRTGDATDLAKAETHSTERDVHGSLREMADLVLDGTIEVDGLVEQVQRVFRDPGGNPG